MSDFGAVCHPEWPEYTKSKVLGDGVDTYHQGNRVTDYRRLRKHSRVAHDLERAVLGVR